jgi:translation initiation factor IF-2
MAQQARPPIVTIMGHVDHGKTTLLDAIRKSRITAGEAGGITQHIGAYQVEHQDKRITFIDTPGHAAFSSMRARGATVTDIVVLVVAGTEGIKPQTVESIKHIKASTCQLIIAANKKDLPGFSAEMVKAQLAEHQIFCEGYGGQTPLVEISAIKQEGIADLLDMIVLVSEIEEITGDPTAPLEAVIIESSLDKHRGAVASAIVRQGTLSIGDQIFLNQEQVKVRGLFNDLGKRTTSVGPGDPVEIIGFKLVPAVGSTLTSVSVEKAALEAAPKAAVVETAEDEEEKPGYNLIIKADTEGTLEAIKASISPDITVIDASVGPVSESDVLMADSTGADILCFGVSVTTTAKRLAEIEKISITSFTIIYKLLEYLEEKMLKIMEPTIDEIDVGEAEIMAIFEMKGDRIAGCKIKSGEIAKSHRFHLIRDGKIVSDPRIRSLKRGKEDIPLAKAGTECGVVFSAHVDFRVGDMLKSYKKN